MDLLDPTLFANGNAPAAFALLRPPAPLLWQPLGPGQGFWATGAYHEVAAVLTDDETFGAVAGSGLASPLDAEAVADGWRPPYRSLHLSDGAEHQQLRGVAARALAPAPSLAVPAALRPMVQARLARLADAGGDLVGDLAAPVALAALGEVVGFDPADFPALTGWVQRSLSPEDPVLGDPADPRAYQRAAGEALLRETTRMLAGEPRGLVAGLHGAIAAGRMTTSDAAYMLRLVLLAGHDSVTQVIAGTLGLLAEHPEARDAARLSRVVDEGIRHTSPVVRFGRVALRDTRLRGQAIRAGERVVVLYAAANMDPAVFADPTRFDVARPATPHLAFGTGPHACPGAVLAPAVVGVVVGEALAMGFPFSLAPGAGRLHGRLRKGWRTLPVGSG